MKLHKAVKMLIKGEAKTISSVSACAFHQTMEDLQVWLFGNIWNKTKMRNWKKFLKATDWEADDVADLGDDLGYDLEVG